MTAPIQEAWNGPGRQDGTITVFQPEYDGLHIDPRKRGHSEWWYFDARLDNGYTVVFFFWARHQRTGKTAVEIVVYPPEGKKIQRVYDYPRSALAASKENANVRIGKNYIRVDDAPMDNLPTYEIFLDEGDLGCHLTYQAQVPGWMPGSGYTQFGKMGHFGWCVALPRAAVQGTITVSGKTHPVTGIGYHDHNWLNFMLPRVVDDWYWGRIYSENFTLIYAHVQCNRKMDNYPVKVMMLAHDKEIVLSTGEYELADADFVYNEIAGNHYPSSLQFTLAEQLRLSLQVRHLIDAENLLLEVGPVLRLVLKHVLRLKPGYFRFSSDFHLTFTRDGKTFEEKGETLHEMVVLK